MEERQKQHKTEESAEAPSETSETSETFTAQASRPPPPRIYRSVTRNSNIPAQRTAHFADDLDLEKAGTNTSIRGAGTAAAPIHGFDLSRVDTARSTYQPQLTPFATHTSYESTHQHTDPSLEPPDGGYGWVCVVAVFFVNAHTWGINSSYGVFLAHYLAENTFPGTTALDYAFVGALSISCGVAISPIAALISQHCGLKFTLLLGATIEAVSLIGASWATEVWQLFLSQGAGFGIGFGLLFVGSVGIVSQWFTTKRSVANGFATAGSGIGGLIYSLATSAMLRNLGQPWTFRVLGILALAVNGTCAILLREWPEKPARPTMFTRSKMITPTSTTTEQQQQQHLSTTTTTEQQQQQHPSMFKLSLLRRPSYLFLLLYATLSMLGYISLLFSLSSYARTTIALSLENAALLTALLNLSQGFGRPTIGLLSDRLGRLNMATFGTFLAGLATLVIWTNAHTFAALIVFSILGGFFVGTFWATIAPVTAEVVGEMELVGPGLNLFWLALVLPCTFAAPIAFRLTVVRGGGYLGCQLFCGWMLVGAAGILWGVRCWKLAELELDAMGEKERKNEVGMGSILRNMWKLGKV